MYTWNCLILICILLASCTQNPNRENQLLGSSIEIDSSKTYAVIEIPAGTSKMMVYDTLTGEILEAPDSLNIDFLPFPGNYGFILFTRKDHANGCDGRPVPVLVLADYLPTQSVLQVLPIATLKLKVQNKVQDLIVSIPVDSTIQTVKAENFVDFFTRYDAVKYILQEWFLRYRGYGEVELLGWEDERFAKKIIAKWRQSGY
jgi:inorganic pyrophosphatase